VRYYYSRYYSNYHYRYSPLRRYDRNITTYYYEDYHRPRTTVVTINVGQMVVDQFYSRSNMLYEFNLQIGLYR
jgi:hypothetical protein